MDIEQGVYYIKSDYEHIPGSSWKEVHAASSGINSLFVCGYNGSGELYRNYIGTCEIEKHNLIPAKGNAPIKGSYIV